MNAPPSIALATMAMEVAEKRAAAAINNWSLIGFWTRYKIPPCDRNVLSPVIHPVSAEFYRILDRLSAGEQP